MATDLARHLFTVDDYHRMAEAGILTEDDRVELLGGEIVEMTPIGSQHGGCVKRLARTFIQALEARAVIGVQDPVILDDLSEPEPDISVCLPRDDDYASAHPRPGDLYLIIEVADTSQTRDRKLKVPRYGRTGVPEVWLIDLPAERIEVYTQPGPNGYAQTTVIGRGDHISPQAFPDLRLAIEDVLGPRQRGSS